MNHIAVLIGQNLNFHVSRSGQVFFEVDPGIAEVGFGLLLSRPDGASQFIFAVNDTHSFSAASGGRLNHHRITDRCRRLQRGIQILDHSLRSRHDRHSRLFHRLPGGRLIPHFADRIGMGTDEGDAARGAKLGKIGIFRQEAVAGVNGVRPDQGGGTHQIGHVQITVPGWSGTDTIRLIGQFHMQRILVSFGIDGSRGNSQFAASPNHTNRDLSTVGDEHLFKQAAISSAHSVFTRNKG